MENEEEVVDLCDRLVQMLMRDESNDAANQDQEESSDDEDDEDDKVVEIL